MFYTKPGFSLLWFEGGGLFVRPSLDRVCPWVSSGRVSHDDVVWSGLTAAAAAALRHIGVALSLADNR